MPSAWVTNVRNYGFEMMGQGPPTAQRPQGGRFAADGLKHVPSPGGGGGLRGSWDANYPPPSRGL